MIDFAPSRTTRRFRCNYKVQLVVTLFFSVGEGVKKYMVVVVHATPVAPGTPPPPLFSVLHDANGAPIATLCTQTSSWWTLGSTRIYSVASQQHQHLVGKCYGSLAEAAQRCHEAIARKSTDWMRTVKLPFSRPLPAIITDAPIEPVIENTFVPAKDPWAVAHAATRMAQPIVLDGVTEPLNGVEIGKCRPLIPPDASATFALERRHWVHFTPKGATNAAAGGRSSSRSEEPVLL